MTGQTTAARVTLGPMKAWLGVGAMAVVAACGSEEPLASQTNVRHPSADGGVAGDTDPETDAAGQETATDQNPNSGDEAVSPAYPVEGQVPGQTPPSCPTVDGSSLEQRCAGLGDERPDRLSEHSAVYDQELQQMVVFGGTPDIPSNCMSDGTQEFLAETWIYDDPCGAWSRAPDAPSARGRHSSVWAEGDMFVFGGRYRDESGVAYTLYNDLLRFGVGARDWSEVIVEGEVPAARAMSALAYDSVRKRLWLFGGNTSASGLAYEPMADLWSFDIADGAWEEHRPIAAPEPRLFHSMLYDGARDRLVVFGGADETAFADVPRYFSNLWAYDIEAGEWVEIAASGSGPAGRFWSSVVHDESSDRYVLFGGHDPGTLQSGDATLGNLNDTWAFEPGTGRWERLFVGDRFNAPSRGFCDFPPNFAAPDLALPERRSAHSMVWSTSCRHGVLFGGKTDCGSVDDVWTFSTAEGWAKRLGAREGEICLRWREDYSRCSDICF